MSIKLENLYSNLGYNLYYRRYSDRFNVPFKSKKEYCEYANLMVTKCRNSAGKSRGDCTIVGFIGKYNDETINVVYHKDLEWLVVYRDVNDIVAFVSAKYSDYISILMECFVKEFSDE